MRWQHVMIVIGMLGSLCLPLRAQVGQPQLVLQMTQKAMAGERWEDAVRGWKGILSQEDWLYPFPREQAIYQLSTCLQRLSRWKEAHDLLMAYLREHPIPSAYTVKMTGHLAAIAYARDGEAGLDRLLTDIIGNPTYFGQFTTFYLDANADMGGPYPLDGAITRYLQSHPACPVTQNLRSAQLGLLTAGGEYQEAWNRAQQWYMDQVGTVADANLIKALCELNARLGAPENAVQMLTALMPVTPDPGKALPPLVEQYRKHAAQLAERGQQIAQALPAALDDPTGTPEKDKVMLEELSKDIPGAVYWVNYALGQYLTAHPDYPRRTSIWLTMARQLAASGDHKAAIDQALPLLQVTAQTSMEATVAVFLAEEHAKRGDFRGAGDLLLQQTSKALAENVGNKVLALKYYRRAGAAKEAADLIKSMGPNPPANPTVADAAFWLMLVAADTGKVEEVKPWVDLLNSIAVEDSRATAARKLLRDMQTRKPE